MSIARKAAEAATVEAPEAPPVETPEAPPAPAPAEAPEPLGAHGAGNDGAREAFLRDEPGPTAAPGEAPPTGEAPAEGEAPAPMTPEKVAELAALVLDVVGQFAGPYALKGSTSEEWELKKRERATVAEGLTPYLTEKLQTTEVSPAMFAVGVVLAVYGTKAASAAEAVKARRKAQPPPAPPAEREVKAEEPPKVVPNGAPAKW